jgi:serine/threonine-protein kinase
VPDLIRGQYEILSEIGKGGMGLVLKARDIKLNRTVALKVLRTEKTTASGGKLTSSTEDEERRRRFFNEAQAASALNHPNIITIYDIVTEGGNDYLVMEFVDGKTLAEVLEAGPMTFKDVLSVAVQMADALAAAHNANIVHRDLKPGNVMLTTRGLVKILDFGLAKLGAPLEDPRDPNDPDATLLTPVTREGFIIGTCAYMSPEQAQGKTVDARSDIFSFGAVLYEMATGRRAFAGDNNITTLSAVLRDEPKSLLEISPNIPTALERLIYRCLRKEPGERWQSMEEVRAALAALKRSVDSGILQDSTEQETVTIPAAGSVPPPDSGSIRKPVEGKGLNNRKVVIAIAVATAVAFGPLREDRPRQEREAKTGLAEEVKEAVSAVKQEIAKSKASRPKLDNDDVIKMVAENVPEDVILGQIRDSQPDFSLDSEDVIALAKAGVSATIIEGMRNPGAIPSKLGGPPPPNSIALTLPDGMAVKLQIAGDLPADVAAGTPVLFTVAEDVKMGDVMAVPRGAAAHGVITEVRKKRGSRPAQTFYRMVAMDGMGGRPIALRAHALKEPEKKDSDLLRPGTEFRAYLDGDQLVYAPKPRPAPAMTRQPGPEHKALPGSRPPAAPPSPPERP